MYVIRGVGVNTWICACNESRLWQCFYEQLGNCISKAYVSTVTQYFLFSMARNLYYFCLFYELLHNALQLFGKCAAHIRNVNETTMVSLPQLLHDTLEPLDSTRLQLLDTLKTLSLRTGDDIKRNNLVLYSKNIPAEETHSSRKRKIAGTYHIFLTVCSQ